MAKATDPDNKTKFSIQEMGNRSFDSTFNINTSEMIGYDGSNLQRVKVNADGELAINIDNNPPTGGSNPSTVLAYDVDGNLETITETIDATEYQTTLSYTDGVLTGVSAVVEL